MIKRVGIPNPETKKMTSLDIEIAVASYFDTRRNIIVPNVYWGLGFRHELDLLVVTKGGHGYEIEIKVSRADLIADKKKEHGHFDMRLRELYFAMPKHMENCIEHVPEHAGVILVSEEGFCEKARNPRRNLSPYKFTDEQMYKLARLGVLRMWDLKRALNRRAEDGRLGQASIQEV